MTPEAPSSMPPLASRRGSRLPWWIATVVLLLVVILAWGRRSSNELVSCYLPAAQAYLDGADMFAEPASGVGTWVYPPLMAWPVVPLTTMPEGVARVVWCAMLVAALMASAWLLVHTLLPRDLPEAVRRQRAVALVVAAIVCEKHLLTPFGYLAHDGFVALALAAGFAAGAQRREALAGAAFGLGAALKVTPGLFLPMLLLQRRWRAAGAMAACVLVFSALPDLVRRPADGPPQVLRFVEVARGATDVTRAGGGHWAAWNPLAQNLSAIVARITTPTPDQTITEMKGDWSLIHLDEGSRRIVTALALAAVAALVVVVVLLSERRVRRGGDRALARLTDVGAVACGMVLLPPHSSKYHFSIVFFAAAACLIQVMSRRRDPFLLACVVLLAILGLPTGRDLVGGLMLDAILTYGAVGLFALAALVGCVRVAWRERNDGTTPAAAS